MDLSSLSSQLNLSITELRSKAGAAGINISPKAHKIDNYLARQVLAALSPKKITEADSMPRPKISVELPTFIQVRDFALKLNRPAGEVVKALVQNGVMATVNEEIDYDTAAIIAEDLGFEATQAAATQLNNFGSSQLHELLKQEVTDHGVTRPPIVTVMGHVDHGKTSLLDAIRSSRVAAGESGGITQHIGAYQVEHDGKKITFLDTPGHEAFAEMRARGATVTDIIVLVVAADDGVRPQTIEVINRAKFSGIPIIVAINKIDKDNANPIKVKQGLAALGVLTEDWGGSTIAVEISAAKNQGIGQLLDMILLQAELLDIKANPDGQAVGTVIESHTESGKGAVASVIVQNGTLTIGDIVSAGSSFGRIKGMEDETGNKLKKAGPAMPVEIAGLDSAPDAGNVLRRSDSLEAAREAASFALKQARSHRLHNKKQLEGDAVSKSLNLIIKADVAGSLEAISQSLTKLKNEEVRVQVIEQGVGEVNESDILLAENSKATVIAYRVKANSKALSLSKQKKVSIDSYDVIYELLEDITSAVVKMFTPEYEHTTYGKAEVLAIFRTEKDRMIVGGKVSEGEIRKNKRISIWRASEQVGKGDILDLQESKVATNEVAKGHEFGLQLKTYTKIQIGDILESCEETLKPKSL